MKRLLLKEVRIFGRTVPVVVILAALTVIVAAAAWVLMYTSHIGGTAGSISGSWLTIENCVVTTGPGTVTCTSNGPQNPLSAVVAGVAPGSNLSFRQVFGFNNNMLMRPPVLVSDYAELHDVVYQTFCGQGMPSITWQVRFLDTLPMGGAISLDIPFEFDPCTP